MKLLQILSLTGIVTLFLTSCVPSQVNTWTDENGSWSIVINGGTGTSDIYASGSDPIPTGSWLNAIIKTWSIVWVDYTLRVASGSTDVIVDTSRQSDAEKMEGWVRSGATFQPLTFAVGGGQMLPAFERAVIGMKVWESKSFTLTPEEWYGSKYETEWIPKEVFNPTLSKKIPKVEVTDVPVAFWTKNNKPIPKTWETVTDGWVTGKVLSVSNSSVKVSVETNFEALFGSGLKKVGDTTILNGNTLSLKSIDVDGWTVEMDNSKSPFVGKPLVVGTTDSIKMESETGMKEVKAIIEKVEWDKVLLSYPEVLNDHPLAWKELNFDVTIVSIQ